MQDDLRPVPKLLDLLQAIGLVAAVGALLYPLGFVQLVARVALQYTHDFTTAWVVASMVPAVQVVGQGLGAIWDEWLFVVVMIGFAALSTYSAAARARQPDVDPPRWYRRTLDGVTRCWGLQS